MRLRRQAAKLSADRVIGYRGDFGTCLTAVEK